MEKKKSKKANLERTKNIFLLTGLIISIAFVTTAFNLQSEKFLPEVNVESSEILEVLPTITRYDLAYKETKKEVENDVEKETQQIIDVFAISSKISKKQVPDVIVEPKTTNSIVVDEIAEPEPDTTFVYTADPPKFPGGILALRRWISKNINYPATARETGTQGTVYLRFEVTKTGSIGKIELQKGVDKLLDEEAINVIEKLPRFKPGMHNGKNVNVWYSIPISFKIN